MTEHRDSPEVEPEQDGETWSTPRRRFARLVESPAARKVALPRLIAASGLALFLALGLAFGGWKLVESWTSWVDNLPKNQIRFAEIELEPAPPPWLKGGRLRILNEVQAGTNLGGSFSLTSLDLKEIFKDFKRSVLVKNVRRVDATKYGRLIVELDYREPVAVVVSSRFPTVFPIDEDGVVIAVNDIHVISQFSPYTVQGVNGPLIEIRGVSPSSPKPKAGLPWKRVVEVETADDSDPMVLRAARLAQFIRSKKNSPETLRHLPDIITIHLPAGPSEPFFLEDLSENLICWGKASEDEKPGDLTAEQRWASLLAWVRAHGPLKARRPNCLIFKKEGAELINSKVPGR